MELMIVVCIIGIGAALAAPAINNAMAERRHREAAADLVRLTRRARSEAAAYGRAHLIRFTGSGSGVFTVWRGTSSGCNTNNWPTIIASAPCGTAGSMCVERIAMNDSEYTLRSMQISVTESAGRGLVDMCYEPTGALKWRVSTLGRFSDLNVDVGGNLQGGFRFAFQRLDSGTPAGVTRQVVVPLGGDARLLR